MPSTEGQIFVGNLAFEASKTFLLNQFEIMSHDDVSLLSLYRQLNKILSMHLVVTERSLIPN